MSISNLAKQKALEYAKRVYKIAHPDANLESGSAIKATLLMPFSLIYSSVFEEKDALRNMHLGNYQQISESEMDRLAQNLLQERPSGSRASTTLRVYLENVEPFQLSNFPYFVSEDNMRYRPVSPVSFSVSDILEDNGRPYVNVPVVSTTFGPGGRADAREINDGDNLPVTVDEIVNPNPTIGGDPRPSNEQFFQYLENSLNDGTTAQQAGVTQSIINDFPEVQSVTVVESGDDRMVRDEIWEHNDTINLDREGRPSGEIIDIGEVEFDKQFRRAQGDFTEDMEGERIAIEDDREVFRTILSVPEEGQAVISGPPLYENRDAEIWKMGAQIGGKADVYCYFPSLEIQSTIIDRREEARLSNVSHPQRFYFDENQISFQEGVVVYQQGTTEEEHFVLGHSGQDQNGFFVELESPHNISPSKDDLISVYNMDSIDISPEGDVSNIPVLYPLQVTTLDPFTFDDADTIPRSMPGPFESPGWYMSNSDPAEIFSAKEDKEIILDEKKDEEAFRPLNIQNLNTHDEHQDAENSIVFDNSDEHFPNTQGRNITIEVNRAFLQDGNYHDIEITEIDLRNSSIDNLDVEALNSQNGKRNDFIIQFFDDMDNELDVVWDEDIIVNATSKLSYPANTLPDDTSYIHLYFPIDSKNPAQPDDKDDVDEEEYTVFIDEDGVYWVYMGPTDGWQVLDDVDELKGSGVFEPTPTHVEEQEFESIILQTFNPYAAEIMGEIDYIVISGSTKDTAHVTVTAEDSTGDFVSNPVRIVYATNSSFARIQNDIDDSSNRLLCDDTLVRSVLPSVIDTTISYSGAASSDRIHSRFIELLQEVIQEVDQGERIRIDVSNIVSALSREDLSESMDVNFEMRVENFLSDGETEVRYLNPSHKTKQKLSVYEDALVGDNKINLQRAPGYNEDISGRGKLILGGNDPTRQEIVPYEAVIEEDEYFHFIIRDGWELDYDHNEWESVWVTKRDYEPELEFDEGAVFIPSENRPYIRRLMVIKQ